MTEEWRKIKGYQNYSVSNLGNVRNDKTGRLLKPGKSGGGTKRNYYQVLLYQGSHASRKSVFIHRLVADAFIPNPDNFPEVNHIDRDGFNNAVSNLEWVTRSENVLHTCSGHKISIREIKSKKVIRVEDGKVFNDIVEAAQDCGSQNYLSISNCMVGRRQTAFGYHWKYLEDNA